MNTANHLWPEGEQFTKEVNIPTNYDPLPVEVIFTVPPFASVVAFYENKDPAKAYPLFRQFIVDWDQQDKLTDTVLQAFLLYNGDAAAAIFGCWCRHMEADIAAITSLYATAPVSIN